MGAVRLLLKSLFLFSLLSMADPHLTQRGEGPALLTHLTGRETSYDWINANRSALIVSGFVVCMPWQKPL